MIVYHIGLPKTGTTYLQEDYFPSLRGNVRCVAKRGALHADWLNWVQFVRGQTNEITPVETHCLPDIVLYSAEEIAATWLRQPQPAGYYPDWQPRALGEVVSRLAMFHKRKHKNSSATVIVGFRSLETFLPSWYAQCGNRHSHHQHNEFSDLLEYVETESERFRERSIVDAIKERFDDVLVYRQEEIVSDPFVFKDFFLKCGLKIDDPPLKTRNQRSVDGRLAWRKRRLPHPRYISKFALLFPKSFKVKIKKIIFSKRSERPITTGFKLTQEDSVRLRQITEKVNKI